MEDTHTSAWIRFGGGFIRTDSSPRQNYLEFSDGLLLYELYWHHGMSKRSHVVDREYSLHRAARSPYWHHIKSLHFHNSIVVIGHGDVAADNVEETRGSEWIPYHGSPIENDG